jgi:hypothetical protein
MMIGTNENARPEAATSERAMGKNACQSNSIQPQFDCTSTALRVQELLCPGQENAILMRDLVSLTGLDARTVRVMIQAERLAGAPILSDNKRGYFLPGDDEERREFVRSMRHRAEAILRAAEAVERG